MPANATDHRADATKAAIREVLEAGTEGSFDEAAASLLRCLGYASERTLAAQTGDVDDFLAQWPVRSGAPATQTQSEGKFRASAASALVLFQVADEEIRDQHQGSLLAETDFKDGLQQSFVFLAVELSGTSYSRTDYAGFAREINKRLAMPAFVLFCAEGGSLTLAFVHRRKHKRDGNRQVLGNVALIRDINPSKPHRAHLDILAELSLPIRLAWMYTHAKPTNFDGLLAALLDTLDTQELNKRFYRDLFGWFNRAVEEATFPTGQRRTLSSEEHVIRLITRLLFVWFIKEKKLIADDLFIEEQVGQLLKGYDRAEGDSHYRAILQNLFFATLNCEVDLRGWSQRRQSTHRLFDRYRYRKEIEDPDALLELFARTPFINGGLFDCLDSVESLSQGGYRIDCFSDNVTDKQAKEYGIVSVPNRLFFDDEGLVTLLNTPAEVEVALDPELLGRVFENLLAAYNPETRETARKQTGSYYTPRPVVDYMVDEALVASLALKAQPADGDQAFWRERLHYLLDYEDAFGDASDLFGEAETDGVIRAIAGLKVLDPACGSGAFPMGVLHKLTLALRRLDPANERWERLQKELAQERAAAAFDTHDQGARDAELTEISATFERYRGSDFGRKLFLIQNSIFGVDIQPVACQIAKLRFFISLAIEQRVGVSEDNLGIKPLPNLETRFVAANTLLPLSGELRLGTSASNALQRELQANRERYFHARTRQQKLDAMDADTRIRNDLTHELKRGGLASEEAERVSEWDPYDQNATVGWFDPRYMFDIRQGFDVTIGNPPYVRADFRHPKHQESRQLVAESGAYETLWEKWDLFLAFMERSLQLLRGNGVSSLIVSDAFCHAKYALKARDWYLRNAVVERIDFYGKIKIFDAAVHNVSYVVRRGAGAENTPLRRVHEGGFGQVKELPSAPQNALDERCFFPESGEYRRSNVSTVELSSIFYISKGMAIHAHETKSETSFKLKDLVSTNRDKVHPRRFVQGKHLSRWTLTQNEWLEWGTERAPTFFSRPTFSEMYEVPEKVLSVDMSASDSRPRVTYDRNQTYHNHSVWCFVPWSALADVRNRAIRKQARYPGERGRTLRPDRRELEKISRRFLVKYVLGIMNSSSAQDYLQAHRRSNLHIFPDDWKPLPIPDVATDKQEPIVKLVDDILDALAAAADADVAALEEALDQAVAKLYGFA